MKTKSKVIFALLSVALVLALVIVPVFADANPYPVVGGALSYVDSFYVEHINDNPNTFSYYFSKFMINDTYSANLTTLISLVDTSYASIVNSGTRYIGYFKRQESVLLVDVLNATMCENIRNGNGVFVGDMLSLLDDFIGRQYFIGQTYSFYIGDGYLGNARIDYNQASFQRQTLQPGLLYLDIDSEYDSDYDVDKLNLTYRCVVNGTGNAYIQYQYIYDYADDFWVLDDVRYSSGNNSSFSLCYKSDSFYRWSMNYILIGTSYADNVSDEYRPLTDIGFGGNGYYTFTGQTYYARTSVYQSAYSDGFDSGVRASDSSAYQRGFDDGINSPDTFYDIFFSLMSAPVNVFQNMLNFELFGINISQLALSLFTLAFIILIVKKVV